MMATPAQRSSATARAYLLTTEDADEWRAIVHADACVMAGVEYARISEKQTGCRSLLFVVETPTTVVAYPFSLRPLESLPFAVDLVKGRWDTFTPEYTGPLRFGPEAVEGAFSDSFARHCREHGIIAEFAHLNPWHASPELLDPACIEVNRDIVYVDLAWGEDRIWAKSLNSDARRHARQAQKAGVRVRRAESREDVREFHRLHELTMRRRRALDRYFFDLEYFFAFFDTMPENTSFVLAEYEGRMVAGGLFLHDAADVYWHLSAVDMEFSRVRPVDALVWDTIRWAVRRGSKRMLMGGAHRPGDGVLHFKASFSPLRAQFRVYKRVHDAELYAAMTRAWSRYHGGCSPMADFFPAYRSAGPLDTQSGEPLARGEASDR